MGHPKYEVTDGRITIDGTNLAELEPDARARLGLFLAFQYPVTIPGVKVADFLRHAVSNIRNPERKEGEGLIPMKEFRKELRGRMEELGIEPEFARRYLNDGFSGARRSGWRSCSWRCCDPSSPSSTKLTAASTATP